MIVAIAGIGNTGKTTLAQEFEKRGYERMGEIARFVFEQNNRGWKEVQQKILNLELNRLEALKNKKSRGEDVVVDRTIVDNLVFLHWRIMKEGITGNFDFGNLQEAIDESKKIYDRIILFTVPIEKHKKIKEYNDELLREKFITDMKLSYGDMLEIYKNNLITN